jgi:hypothetical protein
MNHQILVDARGGEAFLTTDSPASSYGIPVLRIDADDLQGDFGPSDLLGAPPTAMPAAALVAHWARQPERTAAERAAAEMFLRQWPEGPPVEG